jgi:hypothetical protein
MHTNGINTGLQHPRHVTIKHLILGALLLQRTVETCNTKQGVVRTTNSTQPVTPLKGHQKLAALIPASRWEPLPYWTEVAPPGAAPQCDMSFISNTDFSLSPSPDSRILALPFKEIVSQEGDTYSGYFDNAHMVYGKIQLKIGGTLEGYFNQQHRLHGEGRYILGIGWSEAGYFDNGILTWGRVEEKDGTLEIGARVNHRLSDKHGKRVLANGDEQAGEFMEATFVSGTLTRKRENGASTRYIGHFDAQMKLHGEGSVLYSNGIREDGRFVHGIFAFGKRTYSETAYDEGNFVDNRLHGKGFRRYSDGSETSGEFKHGELDGQGLSIEASGTRSEGVFKAGYMLQGVRTFADGTRYEGNFEENTPLFIYGTKTMAHGETMNGHFFKGKPDGEITHTYPDGSSALEMYAEGRRVFRTPDANPDRFNPFEIPPIILTASFEALPSQTVQRHGNTYAGRYIGDQIAFGTVKKSGETYTGSFDADENYHGIGKRTFIDKETEQTVATEEGLFIRNSFFSGKVEMWHNGKKEIHIGPRVATKLEGKNASQLLEDGRIYRGEFSGGELIRGELVIDNRLHIPYPTEKTVHTTDMTPDGYMRYLINGQEILTGTAPTHKTCSDILTKEEAPLLLDPKKEAIFNHFLPKLESVSHDIWADFEKTLPEKAKLGRHVAIAIFGQDTASESLSIMNTQWQKIADKLSSFSQKDQYHFTCFLTQKIIQDRPQGNWASYCQNTFQILMTLDPSVHQGLRTMCRHDYHIPQRNYLDFPVFAAFMGVAKSHIAAHLPHIMTEVSLTYTYKATERGHAHAIYFIDTDRFKKAFDAYFPDNTLSVSEAIQMSNRGAITQLDVFNAFVYGISKTAAHYFKGNGTLQQLSDNAFYRISDHVPESDLASIKLWHKCAKEVFQETKKQTTPTQDSALWSFIRQGLGI